MSIREPAPAIKDVQIVRANDALGQWYYAVEVHTDAEPYYTYRVASIDTALSEAARLIAVALRLRSESAKPPSTPPEGTQAELGKDQS